MATASVISEPTCFLKISLYSSVPGKPNPLSKNSLKALYQSLALLKMKAKFSELAPGMRCIFKGLLSFCKDAQ